MSSSALDRDNLETLGPSLLRTGQVSPVRVAELLATLAPDQAQRVGWAFAGLPDPLLDGLAEELARRGLPLLPIGTTLLERGMIDRALELMPKVLAGHLVLALEHAAPERLRRWIDGCVAELRKLVAADAPTLTLLEVAEAAIAFVPPDEQRAIVAHLEPRYRRELEDGEYEELDYPYGEIDPALRMARVLVSVGEIERAMAELEAREKIFVAFFNFEEMAAARRLLQLLTRSPRESLFWRFRSWARGADDQNYNDRRYEVQWLVHGLQWFGEPVHRALDELIAGELGTAAFFPLIDADLPAELNEHLRARLVELVEEVMPHALQPDQGASVWELLSGVQVLARVADRLSAEQRQRLAEPARRWAEWYVSSSRTNALEQLQTAVGWASAWRDEIEPAARLIFDTVQGGNRYLLQVGNWETLFSPEQLQQIVGSP